MDLKNLIPSLGKKSIPVKQEEEHPFLSLQREMNHLFEGFLQGWDANNFSDGFGSTFRPRIDMTEDDKTVWISAELPGMTDKDIELSLARETLTIRGEKKDEQEERKRNYFYSERTFGSFSRTLRIPREIDPGNVQAVFRKGVLMITLPKTASFSKETKKIPVTIE